MARILAILLLGLALGCSSARDYALVERADLGDADAIYRALVTRAAAVESLRLYGRMDLEGPQLVHKGNVALVARRPSALHVEALSSNDLTLALLVTDGADWIWYERARGTCLKGPWQDEVRLGALRLPVSVARFLSLLQAAPVLGAVDDLRLWWDPESSQRVVQARGQGVEVLHFLDGRGFVTRTRLRQPEVGWIDVRYDERRTIDGHRLPARLRLTLPDERQARLDWRSLQANVPIPDAAFTLTCPAGAELHEVDHVQ
jgi:hypothetical protein